MGININESTVVKATVVFLPDESGIEHFKDYYVGLAKSASANQNNKEKFYFLREVLEGLKKIGKDELPKETNGSLEFDFEINIDGKWVTRTLEIVKKLDKSIIYEIRVDIGTWYFRATFFPYYYGSELYHCVVYPFVKVPGYADPTNGFRDKTHDVYMDVRSNEGKYFNLVL